MKTLLIAFLTVFSVHKAAHAQIITTVAGGGTAGLGDGGAASDCQLDNPTGVAVDAAGNLYIADRQNHRIRKISTAGIITTIAGTGIAGYTSDGGAATLATLNEPYGIATDALGNIYVSDGENHRIRKINSIGNITTIAGTGVGGYNGDDILATNAQLYAPSIIALDPVGALYIADFSNHRVRKITTDGIIKTIAGTGIAGYTGDNGMATSATLNSPVGVAIDATGNIFFTEYENNCIRKIDNAGKITTFAGGTSGYSGDGGPATAAKLRRPVGVAINTTGYLYFSDGFNHCIREVNPAGMIKTIAGIGVNGFSGDGSLATAAKLFGPTGVAVDAENNIFIADWGNDRIRTLKLPTSVHDAGMAVNSFSVYPNPSPGQFTVTFDANVSTPIHLAVHDITGRMVKEITRTTNDPVVVQLDIPTGMYMLSANINGTTVSQKITIIRQP